MSPRPEIAIDRVRALQLLEEGEWEKAAALLEAIFTLRRSRGEEIGLSAHDLASAYNHLGRHDEAARLFLQALASEASAPDDPRSSWTLHGLAAALFALGDHTLAARHAVRALRLAQAARPEVGHSPATIASIADLAAKASEAAGDPQSAEYARAYARQLRAGDAPMREALRCALASVTRGPTDGSISAYRGRTHPSDANEPSSQRTSSRRVQVLEALRTRLDADDARLAIPLILAADESVQSGALGHADALIQDALRACTNEAVAARDVRARIPLMMRTCAALGYDEACAILSVWMNPKDREVTEGR